MKKFKEINEAVTLNADDLHSLYSKGLITYEWALDIIRELRAYNFKYRTNATFNKGEGSLSFIVSSDSLDKLQFAQAKIEDINGRWDFSVSTVISEKKKEMTIFIVPK